MTSSSPSTYRTPVFIGLICVMCFAALLLLHHCVLVACCNRRQRRRRHQPQHRGAAGGQQEGEEEDSASADMTPTSSSQLHLVKAVVCPFGKGAAGAWGEPTCAVCLADFADGEAVRVLPECSHYFHAGCIDTWLRGSTSCPMCRAETTPTPSHTPSSADLHHHNLSSLSVSLEEILVRT